MAEAADVADEAGLEHLTLAAVAGRLGVRLPSLYKHVAGVEALRRDLAVLAVEELAAALGGATVGRSKGEALQALAAAYCAYARAHPGRYAASVRAPAAGDEEHSAASDALLRVVFAVLAGYGVTGSEAVDAIRALRATLHGFMSLEAAGGFGLPQDVDRSIARAVVHIHTALQTITDPDEALEGGST
ncbi:WHG domain-containing protein [Streptomyces sp. NPDC051016]|uniref:WHG domain-containing protein n=1 Tax=Streptomyces sp. NPDC051016 TaxID=3365638 RepID=UPI0037A81447